MYVPSNILQKNYTDAQTDYPLGYIYMGNSSPCCPSPLPSSTPQVLLQFPLEDGGGVFLGEGLECPWLCPHLPQPPSPSPLRSLFSPPPGSPMGQVTTLHCEGLREP